MQSLKDAPDKRVFLEDLIRKVVLLKTEDHDWRFDLASGPKLFTNHGAPPIKDIQTRDDRVDIVVLNDGVAFVFYTKIAQMDGWPPEDKWFGSQARLSLQQP